MKYLYLLLFLSLFSCFGNEKIVYLCGDYICKNKKERDKYFEENLVIEYVKISSKKELKILKKQKEKEEVVLKKNKKKPKKTKASKVYSVKKAKKSKIVEKSDKKINSKNINNVKVVKSLDDFDKIVEAIYQDNESRGYPDINKFSE